MLPEKANYAVLIRSFLLGEFERRRSDSGCTLTPVHIQTEKSASELLFIRPPLQDVFYLNLN